MGLSGELQTHSSLSKTGRPLVFTTTVFLKLLVFKETAKLGRVRGDGKKASLNATEFTVLL